MFHAALFAVTAHAGVVSHTWRESKLSLTLDNGTAAVEWISTAAVRITRNPADALLEFEAIKHDPVLIALEDQGGSLTMRSRFLTVAVDRATAEISIRFGSDPPVRVVFNGPSSVELHCGADAKFYGVGNFFHTNRGFGFFLRAPNNWRLDTTTGIARAADSVDLVTYYGPSGKEILEQHQNVTGSMELTGAVLPVLTKQQLPSLATPVGAPFRTWADVEGFVRQMNQASLSAIQYPALDLAFADAAPAPIKQRLLDLAAVFPILFRSTGATTVDRATRDAFTPYFLTYLREGYDRGYPIIRALPLQFPRDADADQHPLEFMLGDEFLLAPVVAPGNRRSLKLPRGVWTDLRTNTEYRGNQSIEIDAPPGRVPMFARNGSLFPQAYGNRTELHYIPSLGGEFFQWEPRLESYSQYHAAPAGDFLRVQVESKVERTYEWVLHHTKAPSEVSEESGPYRRAATRATLRPGTWWHDARANNLHILLRSQANSDRIVNIAP